MISLNKLFTKLKTFKKILQPKCFYLLKLFIKMDLYLIHFFSSNIIAYTFYIFCILLGHFSSVKGTLLPDLAYVFVYILIGLSFQFFLFCNISFSREFLQNLVTSPDAF